MNTTPTSRTTLTEWLTPATVKLRLTGPDRDSVLGELIALIPELADQPDARERLFRLVLKRHQEVSCAIGYGFATPGSMKAVGLVNRPYLVLGMHPDGVPFAALDGQTVHFFVLRVAPTEASYLALMKVDGRLAKLWLDKTLRSKLLAATSAEELIALILEGEGTMR